MESISGSLNPTSYNYKSLPTFFFDPLDNKLQNSN